MSEDRITEKVYCYDHPSAYNNHDALAIAAMANRRDNNECWPMMAMMNGGMNNHWNDENQRKIQDLKFELSQERQNNLILNRLNGCGC